MDMWRVAMQSGDDRRKIIQHRRDFNQLKSEYFKDNGEERDKEILEDMDDMIVELNDLYGE